MSTIIIKKEDLKKALEIVKPGLANKEIIEQSTSFAFMEGRVVTYNDEISISHPVAGLELTGAIKADEFYQLLNKIKKEEIEAFVTESELIFQIGKAKAGLTLQMEVKLPLGEVGDIAKWEDLSEDFSKNLKFALHSCGSDMSKAVLTGVNICKDGYMESSDGYRILRIKGSPMKVNTFLLPSSAASQVVKLNPNKISSGSGWVHFANKEGTIINCRIFNDQYPEVAPHLHTEGISLILPKSISEILERAAVFSKRDNFIDENMDIFLEDRKIVITGKNDSGWYEEEAPIRYSGEPITFSITPLFLKDILNYTQSCVVGEDRIYFTADNWEFMTLLRNTRK